MVTPLQSLYTLFGCTRVPQI